MDLSQPTVDELIATLKKSDLPTILVEGVADVRIYRKLEEQLGSSFGNVVLCGGRTNLFEIYNQREKLSHIKLVFLADRDMWVFKNTPPEYSEIIWTHGYSIENDIYTGSDVEKLLEAAEREKFIELLKLLCNWFAFEVEEYLAGRESCEASGVGRILNKNRDGLCQTFLGKRKYRAADLSLVKEIQNLYTLKLRGKTLFSLLSSVLSHPNRKAKHSNNGLVEMCVSLDRNPDLLKKLATLILQKLHPQKTFGI